MGLSSLVICVTTRLPTAHHSTAHHSTAHHSTAHPRRTTVSLQGDLRTTKKVWRAVS